MEKAKYKLKQNLKAQGWKCETDKTDWLLKQIIDELQNTCGIL